MRGRAFGIGGPLTSYITSASDPSTQGRATCCVVELGSSGGIRSPSRPWPWPTIPSATRPSWPSAPARSSRLPHQVRTVDREETEDRAQDEELGRVGVPVGQTRSG